MDGVKVGEAGSASGLTGPYRSRRPDVQLAGRRQLNTKMVLGESMARLAIEDKFDEIVEKLLGSKDERVVLDTFKFLVEQAYGRPRTRGGDDSGDKVVEIKFDLGKIRDAGTGTEVKPDTGVQTPGNEPGAGDTT